MAASFFDPNLLPMLELHTDQFRWYPEHRLFAAEASMLELADKDFTWWLQRLYHNDPWALGICLRSHKTGDVKRFHLVADYVVGKKLICWFFESISEDGLEVVIYNE